MWLVLTIQILIPLICLMSLDVLYGLARANLRNVEPQLGLLGPLTFFGGIALSSIVFISYIYKTKYRFSDLYRFCRVQRRLLNAPISLHLNDLVQELSKLGFIIQKNSNQSDGISLSALRKRVSYRNEKGRMILNPGRIMELKLYGSGEKRYVYLSIRPTSKIEYCDMQEFSYSCLEQIVKGLQVYGARLE